jgi:hypothetical protein
VSSEIGAGFGKGKYGIDCSIKVNYGRSFERREDSICKIIVGQSLTAFTDWIYGRTTTFHLFEYPVFYKGNLTGNFLVSVPVMESTPGWYTISSILSTNIPLNHEPGNLLSYPSSRSIKDLPDFYLAGKQITFDGQQVTSSTDAGWNASQTKMHSSSIEKRYNIGVSTDATFKSPLCQVKLHGDYSYSDLSLSSTSMSDSIGFSGHFSSIKDGSQNYYVTPVVYWSHSGAIVVDYCVDFEGIGVGEWWKETYNKPDLALIMPFRYAAEREEDLFYKSQKMLTTDIRYYPYDAIPGDEIEVETTLRNFGLKDFNENASVSFYLGDPDFGGTFLKSINFGKIESRGASIKSFTLPTDSSMLQHPWLFAVIDTIPDELHYNNNKAFIILFCNKYPKEGEWIPIADKILVGINDPKYAGDMEAYSYPNPAKRSVAINYNVNSKLPVYLKILNSNGKPIEEYVLNPGSLGWHTEQVDLTSYSPGLYLYQLISGNSIITHKMIVQ